MASYVELYNLWKVGGDMFARFQIATLKIAGEVLAEDPSTENHTARLNWAAAVLKDEEGIEARRLLKYGIATNSDLLLKAGGANDDDLLYIARENVNRMLAIAGK